MNLLSHTVSSHDFLKSVTFDEHFLVPFLSPVIGFLFNIDNSTLDSIDTLQEVNNHICWRG